MKNSCSNCQNENDLSAKYCAACGYKLSIIDEPSDNTETKTEMKKRVKPKGKWDLKTFLGFAVGFIIMFIVTQSLFRPSVDKQLADFANEFNKTCPINVDQYTTLKNVMALPDKTLQYNYILVGVSKAEVKIDTIKKYVFPQVLQTVKTNPAMKLFRDNKITLHYSYSDQNGEFVTQYIIKPEMYQ